MIIRLARVVPAAADKPVRAGARETQRFAASVALSPREWSPERARDMAANFDQAAASWDVERGGYRSAPLAGALLRGGPWRTGLCLEVGAGTGILTSLLGAHWNPVVGIDLSIGMLRRGHGLRVRADAARLPVPDDVAAAVVIGDAPLFASEVDRVLAPGGAIIWSNALGDGAPYHVATETLVAALSGASDGAAWDAVESQAGWGSWAVLRRHPVTIRE